MNGALNMSNFYFDRLVVLKKIHEQFSGDLPGNWQQNPTPENVVKVQNQGWHELDLVWPEEQTQKTNNTVIYPDFKRNENK
jgi:hypothetical protein